MSVTGEEPVENIPAQESHSSGRPRRYRSLEEFEARAETGAQAGAQTRARTGARPADETPSGLVPLEVPRDGMSRRRFLSLISASAALAVGSSSCSRIDRGKVVPYTRKPPEIIPGIATYYASTFQEGLTAHGVVVKTREGRPLHVEGNAEHPLFAGKTSLRAVGDLLGLYDPDRLRRPLLDGKPASWAEAMARVVRVLKEAAASQKEMLLLTGAVLSPTRRALIEDLKKALPGLRHVSWEPVASDAEPAAARAAFGEWRIPRYRLDRAEVILALQADFLGAEMDVESASGFAGKRRPERPSDPMNRLWVLEGSVTVTGASADHRIPVRPSRLASIAFAMARTLHEKHGVPLPQGVTADSLRAFDLEALGREIEAKANLLPILVEDLRRAGKTAIVIAGPSLRPDAHLAAHLLNAMLGNEGNTVDASLAPPPLEIAAISEIRDIIEQAAGGVLGAAIFWDVNPAYAFPSGKAWKDAAGGIPFKVRLGLHEDETARDCQAVFPVHHWLEAWGDYEPAADLLSLQQPTVGPLHDSRQGEDVLLEIIRALGGQAGQGPATEDYLAYLKARWEKEVFTAGTGTSPVGGPRAPSASFEQFWNAALHDGVLRREAKPLPGRALRGAAVADEAERTAGLETSAAADDFELVLSPSMGVYDGRYANNGWLEELPDPITTMTWENALTMSLADAARLGVRDGDVVKVQAGTATLKVPAVVQPGQAPGVVSLTLGRGRWAGSVAAGVGTNAFELADPSSPSPFLRTGVKLSRSGERRDLPRTQEHHRMEGRDIIRSSTPAELGREPEKKGETASLYAPMQFVGHKWGMVIDLSACVGCAACTVACQSENNVPVVGPERVARGREMHWMRIDRYYEGDPADPRVLHQPVPCQHCDSAPCESVCPVNATTHSPDGLNQMAYNRCVGTRYCANNCPYKVRRFNFFEYTASKAPPETLAFNPEVTVRPRGVMEKCTFCIQRIENGRRTAMSEGRLLRDGEIRPACAVACPAGAIVFGDLMDPGSAVSRLSSSRRGYHLLEDLNVRPAVTYLARVTNPAPGIKGGST